MRPIRYLLDLPWWAGLLIFLLGNLIVPRCYITGLPVCLKTYLAKLRERHSQDLAEGAGDVHLPEALGRKYRNACREWAYPAGPADYWDPEEPGVRKKVQRGGSFLCADQYCTRYMIGTRGKGEIDTPTIHTGFRCVKSGG